MGLAPHQVLHIGDDAHLDAWGARNAGLACIWLNRDDKPWILPGPAVPTVRSLTQVQDWMSQVHP